MNEYRTHNCGELRKENIGQTVKIAGWVQSVRNLGGLVFVDVRDQYGITQAVTSGESELVEEVSNILTESTISVEGKVRPRGEGAINNDMPTGEIEIEIEKIYTQNNYDNKSMLLKDTDERLLNKTGGIIQRNEWFSNYPKW